MCKGQSASGGGTCPACSSSAGWESGFEVQVTESSERFSICKCRQCSLQRTWPVPADLSPYYDHGIGELMRKRGGGLYEALKRYSLSRELRLFDAEAAGGVCLDVGCGSGDFAQVMAQRGLRVAAADSSPEKPLRLREMPDVAYHQMDYDRYEISGLGRMNRGVAVVRHVIEHVKDPALFLRRLREQGAASFYIVVPNAASRACRAFGTYWFAWDPPRHLWHFDLRSLEGVLKRQGITVVRHGHLTSNMVAASFYRYLKLRGASATVCEFLGPKGNLSGVMSVLDAVLQDSMLWVVGQAEETGDRSLGAGDRSPGF